jgi:cytochrome c oxidase cbb3-type subunit 3
MKPRIQAKNVLLGAAFLGLTLIVAHVAAQDAAPAPPAAPPNAPEQGQRRGGAARATFPAQQRPPGDPAVVARGKALYEMHCQSCHAADLRGATGPNLLRSQTVLSDRDGELIAPVIHGSLAGMKAIDLNAGDSQAVAVYIHDIVRTARGQGAPPGPGVPVTNFVVGDAAAGKAYFDAKCGSCHSVAGDLQGIGGRMPDARVLQNLWVSGGTVGGAGRRGGRGAAPAADPRTPTVTVTLASGEKVQGPLVKIDDFIVTLLQPDGTFRSFRRDGDTPKVEVKDPLEAHRALWSVLTEKDMHDVTAYLVTVK